MNRDLMFSRASDEWSTPQDVFDALDGEFHFTLDAAATAENTKCARYFSLMNDALSQSWSGHTVFVNPPYSQCRKFLTKAAQEAARGATVVALVPARTDTRWFHAFVWDERRHTVQQGVELRFVRGRLKFGGLDSSAPFPSAVIIFRPHAATFELRG